MTLMLIFLFMEALRINVTLCLIRQIANRRPVKRSTTMPTGEAAKNILFLRGSAAQGLVTSGYSNTVMFYNLDWSTSQKGVGFLAQDSECPIH